MGSREVGTGTSDRSGSSSPSGCYGKGDAEAEMKRRQLARTGMTRVWGVRRLLALPRVGIGG
jgi:hypothetical protein